MRTWHILVTCLMTALSACPRTPDERVRVVPQVSPIEPKRVAFSPVEEDRLLVMEASGLVGVWDLAADGRPELFATIAASAIDAAFAPDAKSLLTAGTDGKVRRWSVDGQLEWVSQGAHAAPARALAVSSELIASGGEDGAIRLWRHDGTPLGEMLKAHEGPVMSVAISPRGDLVSLGGDEAVRLWKRAHSTATPSLPPTFEALVLHTPQTRRYPEGFIALFRYDASWGWDHSVAFSPRGDAIAAVLFDGSLRLWNADGTSRAVVAKAHRERQVRAVTFSPRGDTIASAGFDGTVRRWNLDGSPHGQAIGAHYNNVFSVAFAPDGARLATAGLDNMVRVWNSDGSLALNFPPGHADRVITVAVAADTPVLAAAYKGGEVRLWNLDGSARGALAGYTGFIPALAFSPTEDVVASAGTDSMLRFWDLNGRSRAKAAAFTTDGRRKINLAFSPSGDALAVGSSSFHLWKQDRLLWERPLRRADNIVSIAFSPGGDFIVTGSALGDIQVWNPDGSSRVGPLKQPPEWIAAVAVPPQGDYFAAVVGGTTPLITLFNLDGTARGAPLEGHLGGVNALAFSPTGRLASGDTDGVVRLWTLPSRQVETIEVGLPINQLGFRGDMLWVRANGESVFFYGPGGTRLATVLLRRTAALAFTPEGSYSGSEGATRFVRLYRQSGEPLSQEQAARRFSSEKLLQTLKRAG